jgi:hypothetical protein
MILLISTSSVVSITCMSHHAQSKAVHFSRIFKGRKLNSYWFRMVLLLLGDWDRTAAI